MQDNLNNENNYTNVENTNENIIIEYGNSHAVINKHDFQEAKNSIKIITENKSKELKLIKVDYSGGLFNQFDHWVTGSEFNTLTSQIQDSWIHTNKIIQGILDTFLEVYKSFEYLDKDYISGILTAIKSAEEVSKKEQQDRKDIRNIIENIEVHVQVLKKFKEDIDQLKHINDIDKLWDMIEKQENILNEYKYKLEKLFNIYEKEKINTDEKINSLGKKMKLFHFILCACIFITTINLILNIFGII